MLVWVQKMDRYEHFWPFLLVRVQGMDLYEHWTVESKPSGVGGMVFAEGAGMISWKERVLVTAEYGLGLLVLGGLFNVVYVTSLADAFSYEGVVLAFVLKGVFTGVVLYLRRQFENRDAVFFYINLGLTRRRMMTAVLVTDFVALTLMLAIVILLK